MARTPRFAQKLIRGGVDRAEALLIDQAIGVARNGSRARASLDYSASRSVRRSLSPGGDSFRDYHKAQIEELTNLSHAQIAFGDVPDRTREEHSAFCYLMHRGFQQRFIDRKEKETVEEFLDRPRKACMNVTSLVINILSKLYHRAPAREFDKSVPEPVRSALSAVWANPLWNATMLEADRFTRLVGTVAIRPFYDPTIAGRIRPWVFLSHQLRVVPDPKRPWVAAAVIERARPFEEKPKTLIWTARSMVTLQGRDVTYEGHSFGRIPHVFVRDRLSFTSFFAEGRGRMLCSPNVILNNGLTDLEEIKQLQGFAIMEVVNPAEDTIAVGPRRAIVFRPDADGKPFGVKFVSPDAPLADLRKDVEGQLADIMRTNRVPEAAVSIALGGSPASGRAIQEAMRPISDDLEERAQVWAPAELDLADSVMRVLSANSAVKVYDPIADRPMFDVTYQPLEFNMTTSEQVTRDDHLIATGQETPAGLMRDREPDRFKTHDEAVVQWRKNLDEMAGAGFDPEPVQESEAATYGPAEDRGSVTPLLDMVERSGQVQVA